MHAVQNNHRHPYSSNTTTHFNVQQQNESGSGSSDSASIDVVVRGGEEEQDIEDEEHLYFAPQINMNQNGAHVETNPSYKSDNSKNNDENPYFNPHYISRNPSSADSHINNHYPTANGTPIDLPTTPPHHPHYYEIHPQNSQTAGGVNLIPLALVDREVNARRVSALIVPSVGQETASKFSRHSQQNLFQQQQGAARTGRRRFSVATNSGGGTAARKMAGEEVHYAQSIQMFPPPPAAQKETLGRRAAQKFLQQKGAFRRAKPGGGSKLAALGSELSQSASALYSLFTTTSSSRNADTMSDDETEVEFDRRSVLSVDHLHFHNQNNNNSHYQQPTILSHQTSLDSSAMKSEQIYASSNVHQMNTKVVVSLAMQAMMDLTDKTEDVSEHTQRGIEFLEKYGKFAQERAAIEDDYASKIRGLVKKFSGKKKENDEWMAFSYVNAFQSILREVESLAIQHEVISDKLKKEICPAVMQKCQEFRAGRKRHIQELGALNNAYQAQIDNMQRHLKAYTKAFKETETAHVKYYKADNNMDLSRAEVAKCGHSLQQKIFQNEQAKQHYAAALETTNTAQRSHFNEKIPHLLDEMRRLDIDRIQVTKQTMMECVDVETGVMNIIQRCYNDMKEAIRTIDPPKDTHIVVEQQKTGYAIPTDFEFKDLGDPISILQGNGESATDGSLNGSTATLKRGQVAPIVTNGKTISRKPSMHQRIFGGPGNSNGKSNGTSDYGNLPPQQRCRKIETKLQELHKEIQTREQSKAGLEKMLSVYTKDPKMGSAADVSQQMKQFDTEIAALRQQMDHFNRLLADTQKELNVPFSPISSLPQPPTNGVSNGHTSPRMPTMAAPNNNRVSYSEDSVSSDGSAVMGVPRRLNGHVSSIHSPHASNIHIPHIDSSAETVSNSNGSHRNANTSSSTSAAGGDLYEDPDDHLPPLGTCKAIYPFEGAASGDSTTISMNIEEELHLLEKDDGQGDGWTRVRNPRTGLEGFVPSSYLGDMNWFK